MTIRIYALAKQLKKTSKELLEVCPKLGISGKANQLASLTAPEVEKISAYFSGTSSDGASGDKNKPVMIPPKSIPASEKKVHSIPVITVPRAGRLSHLFGGGLGRQRVGSGSEVTSNANQQVSDDSSVQTLDGAESKVNETEPNTNNVPVGAGERSRVDSLQRNDAHASSTFEEGGRVESNVSEVQTSDKTRTADDATTGDAPEGDSGRTLEGTVTTSVDVKASNDAQLVAEQGSSTQEVDVVRTTDNLETVETDERTVSVVVPSVPDTSPNGGEQSSLVVPPSNEVETRDNESASQQTESVDLPTADSENKIEKATSEVASESGAVVKESVQAAGTAGNPQGKYEMPERSIPATSGGIRRVTPQITKRGQRRGKDERPSKGFVDERVTRLQPPPYAGRIIDRAALEEMKQPPMITPPSGSGRVQVLGGGTKRPNSSGNGGVSSPRSGVKVTLGRFASMPTAPTRAIPKKPEEQTAQKPVTPLTPDVINRARNAGKSVSELVNGSLRAKGGARQGGEDSRRTDGQKLGGKSGRTQGSNVGYSDGQNSRKSQGYGRGDRDGDGQEARRRNQNSQRRARNPFQVNGGDDDGYTTPRSRAAKPGRKTAIAPTVARVNDIVIEAPCTVKDFSGASGVGVAAVIKELMKLGMMKTINQTIDRETIELLIMSFELKATVKEQATLEEQYVDVAFTEIDSPESLKPRAPVVTFLGHVDHGKTSLLDRILHLHVASGEKGGITQHIRAYRIDTPRGPITFVDTPGHEAFTAMRARGANCTDIAVLVVAADDGVMPQTEEAISHAKAAGVPIIVALNKMDLPGVKRDRVIQELASNDLTPSEWGGDVEIVETSAVTGLGIDELLETIVTLSELNNLSANPDRNATGVVLEASLQSGEGVVCKALVQNGTLRNGDVVLCGAAFGRVRSMTDTLDSHKKIKEAGPSVPVSLVGLDVAPEAGSKFVVLDDISIARQIAEERSKRLREIELAGAPSHVTLENLFERMNSAKSQRTLNVIIRADVRGSIEAIRKEMGKLEHPEVKVKILQASVGGVTEADVHLADASDAIIVGFNVVPDEGARALAETKKIQIRRYDVIYKLTDDIRAALEGMLKPIEQVKELGRALVQRVFNISRVGSIAGCRVIYGVIERDCQIRVVRDSRVIGEYALDTLKREKDDAKEVREGYECGMKLKNYNDVKEGDILEAYKIEEIARTF